MKRSTFYAMWLGLALTAAVLLLHMVGEFTPWERMSYDMRYRYAPRPSTPMTDEIFHVDIDDGAMRRIGRWPWDRSKLAHIIDELRLAGAKTIAFDVRLSEPQSDGEDKRLAQSITQVNCVLPVVIGEETARDQVWQGVEGAQRLEALLDALGADIQLEEDDILELVELSPAQTDRFVRGPYAFKEEAAWRKLWENRDDLESFKEFESTIAPNLSSYTDRYAERGILESAWRHFESWRTIGEFLRAGGSRGSFDDLPPLPALAEKAGGFGFVNAAHQTHPDGSVREIVISVPAKGGSILQFGLAAAAVHRGIHPREIIVTEDAVQIGDVSLPRQNGKIWIPWPTSDTEPRWEGLLRRGPTDPSTHGHISIRLPLELADAKRLHLDQEDQLLRLSERILNFADPETFTSSFRLRAYEELSDELIAFIEDEIDFVLEDVPEPVKDTEGHDPDEIAYLHHAEDCRNWRWLRPVIGDEDLKIKESTRTLREQVAGKLVFIGFSAGGVDADVIPTPIDAKTPGVIVHAAIADMALTGRSLSILPVWEAWCVTILLGILGTIIAGRLPSALSVLVQIAVILGYLAIAGIWLFGQRSTIMPIVAPITAGISSWIGVTALQAGLMQRDRQRIQRQFKARVSSQLTDYLAQNPDALTKSGEEREITVMFGDLAGFTAISERLGGPTTVSTLNRYLGALTERIVNEDAYVNKFLGDGFMAFWSAFETDAGQADKACRAALRCQSAIDGLNEENARENLPPLGLRCGIATGRVIVGDCGAPPNLNDYTVIGDAVNLAARLETANKQFGTRTLVNGRTRELVRDSSIRLRPVGRIIVVGQTESTEAYELLPADAPDEMIRVTEELVKAYQEQRFDDAEQALDALTANDDSVKLVGIYRDAISAVRKQHVGETMEFDGAIRLRMK